MEEEISVKTLFAATGFSVSGCRAQFDWLVANGFLITAKAENDKRRQVVIPTPKLKDKFLLLLQAMEH
jgi:DNA-binding MarR family transcriptional regulator